MIKIPVQDLPVYKPDYKLTHNEESYFSEYDFT